jgi:hypothetical protein
MLINVFYPFINNSPANQARGVLALLRRWYPTARIMEWDYLGQPRRQPFDPPGDADLNFVFDMSFHFFREGRELFDTLTGPVLVGSIEPHNVGGAAIGRDEVVCQLVVGKPSRPAKNVVQIGYFPPLEFLEPARPQLPLALIDHWRHGHPSDRQGSIECSLRHTRANYETVRQVLAELHIPFVELGHHNSAYSQRQIFDLYRRCHFFFLTFYECFGLSLLENAITGSWLIAPTRRWLQETHLMTCPGFFSWDWDIARLHDMLAQEKEAILTAPDDYARRRHDEQMAWYCREYRYEQRLLELIDGLAPSGG